MAITGCNTGIGKFTALDMSRRGAKVVMLCRNVEAAEVVAEEIRKETEGEVIVHRSFLLVDGWSAPVQFLHLLLLLCMSL